MSSMRNAVQRRNHRERAQPKEREKWGLLEKHKDYSLRAKDYNAKKARLKILRQKATDRNPDEFHYGMLSNKSKQGRKIADRGNPVLSHAAVKLLKTQDAGYLQTMIQKTRRAIERFEGEFVLGEEYGGGEVDVLGREMGRGEKIVFVDNQEEQQGWTAEVQFGRGSGNLLGGTVAEDQDLEINERPIQHSKARRKLAKEEQAHKEETLVRRKHKNEQNARRTKLAALKLREKDLRDAENELELQRAKMSNTVGGINKAGVKWKVRERKR
ncbi:MAG: hypothetical protein Q9164_000336 [Protoblastenia rupestris]